MRCEALDGLGRSVDQGQAVPVAREHAPHDLCGDLVGLIRDAEVLVEVPGPLGRAHAHHRPLRLVVVAAAALADEGLANLVPDLLALDQDAVQVEDDRLGPHSTLRYSPPW